ncbi:prefoldin subunit 4 isoform X1 [Manis pentadactyla]|uniref:prefoldin subunit 4 isoform X1 n=1 Tax=Manis pentadactyla TaxID=143292 RepID=UPI00255CE8D9|nr:prefoldin subunit 4 isoform X1 [Manis pentadactyla]
MVRKLPLGPRNTARPCKSSPVPSFSSCNSPELTSGSNAFNWWNLSYLLSSYHQARPRNKQLQNLEDACEDLMLAEDDCLMIPYQIGDVFISHSQEETQEMLEEAKKNLQEEIDALESRVESIQRVLADLKVQLYAKFGSNINLEADES